MTRPSTTRRDFLRTSAAIGAAVYVGHDKAWSQEKSPNERVRYACIGVGGKGGSDSTAAGDHGEVVAICDVDEQTLGKQSKNPAFKKPQTFTDYRELFEKMGDKI